MLDNVEQAATDPFELDAPPSNAGIQPPDPTAAPPADPPPATQTPPLQTPQAPISPQLKAAFYARFFMKEFNRHMTRYFMSPWAFAKLMDPMAWLRGPNDDAPFEWMFQMPQRELHRQIEAQSQGFKGGYRGEVPHISGKDLDRSGFDKFHQAHAPVVIKGFMKDTPAVNTWTLPWLRDHYGSEPIYVVQTKDGYCRNGDQHKKTTLARGIQRMLKGEKIYMFGSSNLLINHPELVDRDLNIQQLAKLCDPALAFRQDGKIKPHILQLFMGIRKTGTTLHCASATNMTLQIHGTKRWTLVPPQFTPYLYPVFKDDVYADSPIDVRKTADELIREGYGLGRHVPHYSATLEPGDVLFNPAWWWHWVETTSDASLAVAHRFMANKMMAGNPTLQLVNMTGPRSLRVMLRYMMEGKRVDDTDILDIVFPSEHQG